MSQQKILALMKECSSAKPMPFDELVEKSGLLPDTLRMVLDQMQQSRPATVNSCLISKDGKTRTVYWPTGAVAAAPSFHEINARNWQREIDLKAASTPPQQEPEPQEEDMPPGKHPGKLSQKLYTLIQDNPGIARKELVSRALSAFPDRTRENVIKTLANLAYASRKVRTEGGGYYLMDVPCKASEPAKAAAPQPVRQERDDEFSISLTDDNFMHLGMGDEMYTLNPSRVKRLKAFMDRIVIPGAAA